MIAAIFPTAVTNTSLCYYRWSSGHAFFSRASWMCRQSFVFAVATTVVIAVVIVSKLMLPAERAAKAIAWRQIAKNIVLSWKKCLSKIDLYFDQHPKNKATICLVTWRVSARPSDCRAVEDGVLRSTPCQRGRWSLPSSSFGQTVCVTVPTAHHRQVCFCASLFSKISSAYLFMRPLDCKRRKYVLSDSEPHIVPQVGADLRLS